MHMVRGAPIDLLVNGPAPPCEEEADTPNNMTSCPEIMPRAARFCVLATCRMIDVISVGGFACFFEATGKESQAGKRTRYGSQMVSECAAYSCFNYKCKAREDVRFINFRATAICS